MTELDDGLKGLKCRLEEEQDLGQLVEGQGIGLKSVAKISSVLVTVSLRFKRNIEMRMSKCLLDKLAWDIYVLFFSSSLLHSKPKQGASTTQDHWHFIWAGKKIQESSKKQNLELPYTSKYLCNIYITLVIIINLEMI